MHQFPQFLFALEVIGSLENEQDVQERNWGTGAKRQTSVLHVILNNCSHGQNDKQTKRIHIKMFMSKLVSILYFQM